MVMAKGWPKMDTHRATAFIPCIAARCIHPHRPIPERPARADYAASAKGQRGALLRRELPWDASAEKSGHLGRHCLRVTQRIEGSLLDARFAIDVPHRSELTRTF